MPRPSFKTMLYYAKRINYPNIMEVGRIIGGKVKDNIYSGIFENTCSIKMSYALNRSGTLITKQNTQGMLISSGGDGFWYLPRLTDLRPFLTRQWGNPIKYTKPSDLVYKQGLIITDTSFGNATGHATLLITALKIPPIKKINAVKNSALISSIINDDIAKELDNKVIGICHDSHCYFDDLQHKTNTILFWKLS